MKNLIGEIIKNRFIDFDCEYSTVNWLNESVDTFKKTDCLFIIEKELKIFDYKNSFFYIDKKDYEGDNFIVINEKIMKNLYPELFNQNYTYEIY